MVGRDDKRSQVAFAAALVAAGVVCLALLTAGAQAGKKPAKGRWLSGVTITEYFPTPEKWFDGRRISAPGLKGEKHRVDWLYSARGLPMEGDGIGLNGKRYHFASGYSTPWVNRNGRPATWGSVKKGPYWLDVGWRNKRGYVTYPKADGTWSRGEPDPKRFKPPKKRGVGFGFGPSLPLKYWRSLATDPGVIKRGSRVYIPFYRNKPSGGWFVAQDTGGAIDGRHVDVFRPAPADPNGGRYMTGKRICVIPPRKPAGACASLLPNP